MNSRLDRGGMMGNFVTDDISMHICLVTSSKIPVKKYGGTERIVEWLALEFLKLGHQVTLVALPGSAIQGVNVIEASSKEEALERVPVDADIVHFHGWPPSDDFHLPWVYTLHGNHPQVDTLPKNTVFISQNHADRHGGGVHVYNGINPDEFVFDEKKDDYLLFFSKVRRRVKGARRALKLTRETRQNLLVAGGYRVDLLKVGGFFDSFRPGVKFVGEVGGTEKANYFSKAKALVFPIDWEEPFGLVMVEALMSGTPVIATPRGSVPEIIHEGVGALFSSDEEFSAALEHALACTPQNCRQYAMGRFSIRVCAQNYLSVYQRCKSGELFA